jgi:hypothetical protein
MLTLGDLVDVLIPRHQFTRHGNVRSRLNLVSGQHPNLQSSIPKQL